MNPMRVQVPQTTSCATSAPLQPRRESGENPTPPEHQALHWPGQELHAICEEAEEAQKVPKVGSVNPPEEVHS